MLIQFDDYINYRERTFVKYLDRYTEWEVIERVKTFQINDCVFSELSKDRKNLVLTAIRRGGDIDYIELPFNHIKWIRFPKGKTFFDRAFEL